MCGIAGVLNFDKQPVSHNTIKSMVDMIAHRGPDGEGIFIDNYIALGHRRLSILDVSPKGAQPMASHNGEWIIVFNGCIYNYLDLKLELMSKGHNFVSTGDTEVICEGISEYGIEFFKRLDGMFAIGAWHKPSQTLWLSRDRYGVKPLYYYQENGVLLFASEIKAFLNHPKFKVKVNLSALNEYFTLVLNLETPSAIFEEIEEDDLLNCETNPNFSDAGNFFVVLYTLTANCIANFQISSFSKLYSCIGLNFVLLELAELFELLELYDLFEFLNC